MKQNTVIVAIGDSGKRIVSGIEYEYPKIMVNLEPKIEQDLIQIEVWDKNNIVVEKNLVKIYPKYNIHKNEDGTIFKFDLSTPYFLGDKEDEIFDLLKEFENVIFVVPLADRSTREIFTAFANLCADNNKQATIIAGMPLDFEGKKACKEAPELLKYIERKGLIDKYSYENNSQSNLFSIKSVSYDYSNVGKDCTLLDVLGFTEEKTRKTLVEIIKG